MNRSSVQITDTEGKERAKGAENRGEEEAKVQGGRQGGEEEEAPGGRRQGTQQEEDRLQGHGLVLLFLGRGW